MVLSLRLGFTAGNLEKVSATKVIQSATHDYEEQLWARFTLKPGFSGQRLSSASLKVSTYGWKVKL